MCIITLAELLAQGYMETFFFTTKTMDYLRMLCMYRLISQPVKLKPILPLQNKVFPDIDFDSLKKIANKLINRVKNKKNVTDVQLLAWGKTNCIKFFKQGNKKERERMVRKIVFHMAGSNRIFVQCKKEQNSIQSHGSPQGYKIEINPNYSETLSLSPDVVKTLSSNVSQNDYDNEEDYFNNISPTRPTRKKTD